MLAVDVVTRLRGIQLEVALDVPAGRCLALAGPSGAGKTTILRIVAGLLAPRQGIVRCGEEVWLDTERGLDVSPERRRIGFLFQGAALFPHLSALDNVAYGVAGRRRTRRERARGLLERLGVAHLAAARPGTLSGGERQRVALARALAREPRALLLDEPLSALDPRARGRAGRELREAIESAEVPALLVTHDFEEAAWLGDEVAVLDSGRIVQRGSPERLAAEPASVFVADLAGTVALTGTASPGPGGLTSVSLDGGGTALAVEAATGAVMLTLFPWEVALEPKDAPSVGSAQNRLPVRVSSVTRLGNRMRVGLRGPQPLVAELTAASAERLDLRRGVEVVATWKATATRLVPLG